MSTERVSRAITAGINANQGPLDALADGLQGWLSGFVQSQGRPARRFKDVLNGVWLGHPLHPTLTDIPIGAWCVSTVMDLLGSDSAADASLAIGVVAAVPTALAGMADWSDTQGQQRRNGLVHALANTVALTCFTGSLLARRRDSRGWGMLLSTVGLGLASGSAWIGGELVYRLGQGVSRNAWDPAVPEFTVAARADTLAEGKLSSGEVVIDGKRVPLVLLKRGDDVLALSSVCSHMGGPLAEGQVVEDACVECPWHASRFDMATGAVRQGPATASAPAFEARVTAGNVEVRSRG